MTDLNTSAAHMLASIFKDVFGQHQAADEAWRGPIASVLDDLAHALKGGVDPHDVAVICEAAAEAIRHPAQIDKIREKVEKAVQVSPDG